MRRADKITLPRSASLMLEQQQATKNGQLFFELSNAQSGRTTHASILDFSAADGTVGCPPEVLANQGLDEAAMGAGLRPSIVVRYRALKRGTFAKVQPVKAAFASDVGDGYSYSSKKFSAEESLRFVTVVSMLNVRATSQPTANGRMTF